MKNTTPWLLTDAQLRAEAERCEFCEEKPCMQACPADCSPADFMMAVAVGEAQDFHRATERILAKNPLGGVCGAVCPDTHCMKACSRRLFDRAVEIPAVQSTIVARARAQGFRPAFAAAAPTGFRIAVLGAGPAGHGAAAVLAQLGHAVEIFASDRDGGMAALIPPHRLDPAVLAADLAFVRSLGDVTLHTGSTATPEALRARGFAAVVVATGLPEPLRLGIPGETSAIAWTELLAKPAAHDLAGRRVAVIGGGAVAVDCAETALHHGAAAVEMLALETLAEMPLTAKERAALFAAGVEVTGRCRVTAIDGADGQVTGIGTRKVQLPAGATFHPRAVVDVPDSDQVRTGFAAVVVAIGARSRQQPHEAAGVFVAGDAINGPTTVVEAVAAGKNAAQAVHAYLAGQSAEPAAAAPSPWTARIKSRVELAGYRAVPVALDCDFFGTPLASPFLLSAAPPTDGYEQMRKAYEAGWAGGVMKTAFAAGDVHIPGEYMFAFNRRTYANCDNVSGHSLDRVCREVERLRREFPDRLTLASTGGPVTGDDDFDRRGWQANTRTLEDAGACGIEYSLSCPQGGDGTKGDIVSQDAELTAKIVGWVMEVSDPDVPKLFKLTAAVTSIHPIVAAIREVFARHAAKKAGVTLANTFPTLAFRRGRKATWEEGVVVGMSGEGVIPISNLTLANVSRLGVVVSGNGGPMNYKSAAHFLALGARTVQFCTVAMKHGVGIVTELHSGLSHLLAARGMRSVRELIGRALPDPITGFMQLSAAKKISAVTADLCEHCGNCARCPYLAVSLDDRKVPATDPARCIGCSICVQKCFAGALLMRERTAAEAAALVEA